LRFSSIPFAGKGKTEGGTVFTRDANNRVVWHDPPPAGVEPDPDYVPEVGKWFWFRLTEQGSWFRYHRINALTVHNDNGSAVGDMNHIGWIGKMLPAEPPE